MQKETDLPLVSSNIPRLPPKISRAIRFLPLMPLSISLSVFSKRVARQHSALFSRLGEYDRANFTLDPTDLPFVIDFSPNGGDPQVRLRRGAGMGASDVRIAGPLAALLGLVHGAFDGDALFFSRDLMIEGDTGAALALRNTIDDAELDLAKEIKEMSGPFARPLQSLISLVEGRTGVCLSRPKEVASW